MSFSSELARFLGYAHLSWFFQIERKRFWSKLSTIVLVVLVSSCMPIPYDPPSMELPFHFEEIYTIKEGSQPLKSGDRFYYSLSVTTLQPMRNVVITVQLPDEVIAEKVTNSTFIPNPFNSSTTPQQITSGQKQFIWKGEVVPHSGPNWLYHLIPLTKNQSQSMNLFLVSRSDSRNWSAKIRGNIKYQYDPLPRDVISTKVFGEEYEDNNPGEYFRNFSSSHLNWTSTSLITRYHKLTN